MNISKLKNIHYDSMIVLNLQKKLIPKKCRVNLLILPTTSAFPSPKHENSYLSHPKPA